MPRHVPSFSVFLERGAEQQGTRRQPPQRRLSNSDAQACSAARRCRVTARLASVFRHIVAIPTCPDTFRRFHSGKGGRTTEHTPARRGVASSFELRGWPVTLRAVLACPTRTCADRLGPSTVHWDWLTRGSFALYPRFLWLRTQEPLFPHSFYMAHPRFLRLPGGLPAVSHGLPAVWLTRVFLWLTCGSPARAYMTGTAVLIDTLLAWALLLHLLVAAVSGCRNAV